MQQRETFNSLPNTYMIPRIQQYMNTNNLIPSSVPKSPYQMQPQSPYQMQPQSQPQPSTNIRDTSDKYCGISGSDDTANSTYSQEEIANEYVMYRDNPFLTEEFARLQYNVKLEFLKRGLNPFQLQPSIKVVNSIEENPKDTVSIYPLIENPDFNKALTDIFAGKTTKCNFKTDYIPEPSESGCSSKRVRSMSDLHPYQRVVSSYVSPSTPYRGLLVYHSVGTGKTITSISVMANFLKKDPKRIVIVLVPPSLKGNYGRELDKVNDYILYGKSFNSMEERKKYRDERVLITTYEMLAHRLAGTTPWNYPSLNKSTQFGALQNNTKQMDSSSKPLLENTLIIIDEIQNVTAPSKGQQRVYPDPDDAKIILQSLRYASNLKLLLLTATPMRNDPYELGILLNLLKGPDTKPENLFPVVYTTEKVDAKDDNGNTIGKVNVQVVDYERTQLAFNAQFIEENEQGFTLLKNQDKFLQLSRGLVSYYNAEYDYSRFVKVFKEPTIVYNMTSAELKKYETARKKDLTNIQSVMSSITDPKKKKITCSYSNYSICNSSRNYANELKIEGLIANIESIKNDGTDGNFEISKQFAYSELSFKKIAEALKAKGWQEWNLNRLMKTLKSEFQDPNRGPRLIREQSNTGEWQENIMNKFDTNSSMYRQLVQKGGKNFLVFGFGDDKTTEDINRGETTEYGEIVLLSIFNMTANKRGEFIPLIVGNTKIKEGISLFGVRAVHLLETPKSMTDYQQIVGRATRDCSHRDLAYPSEWKVKIYRYIATHETFSILTADHNQPKTVQQDNQIDDVLNTLEKNNALTAAPILLSSSDAPSPTPTLSADPFLQLQPPLANNDNFLNAIQSNALTFGGNGHGSHMGSHGSEHGRNVSSSSSFSYMPPSQSVTEPKKRSSPTPRVTAQQQDGDTSCENYQTNCAQQEHCRFNENTMQCNTMPIDDIIQKMSDNNRGVGNDFLKLLQLNAIDCEIFKDFNQIKNNQDYPTSPSNPLLTCYKPIEPSSALLQKQTGSFLDGDKSSGLEITNSFGDNVDCSLFADNRCNAIPQCYLKTNIIGKSCKKRVAEGYHGDCRHYHENEDKCMKDPYCVWDIDKKFFAMFDNSNKPHCRNKYKSEMNRYENAIGLTLNFSNEYEVFALRPSLGLNRVKLLGDIQKRFKTYDDFLKAYNSVGNTTLTPLQQLNILQALVATSTPTLTHTYEGQIREMLFKNQQLNRKDWLTLDIDLELKQLVSTYNFIINQQITGKILNFECVWQEGKYLDLEKIHTNVTNVLNYIFHFYIENKNIYISSTDIVGAPLSLAGLEHMSLAVKQFTVLGLFITIQFVIVKSHLQRIFVQVINNGNLKSTNTSTTTWIVNDKGSLVNELSNVECIRFWNDKKLSMPLIADQLNGDADKLQSKECWYKWNEQVYPFPVELVNEPNELKEYCMKATENADGQCNSKDQCWLYSVHKDPCRKLRFRNNPFECGKRGLSFWKNSCYRTNKNKGGKRKSKRTQGRRAKRTKHQTQHTKRFLRRR